MDKTTKKAAIFVLGMHRSGTSTFASGLTTLGIDWGTNLLERGEDNPKGFWEDKKLLEINRKILLAKCSDGDFAHSLVGQIDFSQITLGVIQEINKFIERKSEKSALWGCKDPRCCLTFPLWEKQLLSQNISPIVLMVIRNPLEVALSLNKRNAIPIRDGIMLWMSYNYAIIQNAGKYIKYIVSYDDILEDPYKVLCKIASILEINRDNNEKNLIKFSSEFISKELRHHKAEDDQFKKACGGSLEAYEFYQKLVEFSRNWSIHKSVNKSLISNISGISLLTDTCKPSQQKRLFIMPINIRKKNILK